VVWPGAVYESIKDVTYDSLGNIFISYVASVEGMYLQKCTVEGERLWGDYGVPVNVAAGMHDYQQSVPDGQGEL